MVSISVKHHGDTLKDPVTIVTVGLDVGFENASLSHGVLPVLSYIDRGLDCVPEFQLVRFYGNDLDQRHLFNQFLRAL